MTVVRRDELVDGVVPEVVMVMAGREFEQPVVGGDVHVGIADENISIADVGGADGKPQHAVLTGRHSSLDNAAGSGTERLVVNDPAIRQSFTVHNEVGRPDQVLHVVELRSRDSAVIGRTAGAESSSGRETGDNVLAHG